MLKKIKIQSFIIFKDFEIDFAQGMTAITGTTGSGKSIIFDAIEFALGNKMTRAVKDASVELVFDQVTIKHIKSSSSKFYINNELASKVKVQELAPKLIICQRQNQHLKSLDNAYQRQVLDLYANVNLTDVNLCFDNWQTTKQKITQKNRDLKNIDVELSQHYLSELEQLQPSLEDWQQLNEQLQFHKENKKQFSDNSKSQALIKQVVNNLHELLNVCAQNKNIEKCLNEAYVLVQEADYELEQLGNRPELSEYELQAIDERMQEYFRLARKHKVKPEDLTDIQASYQQDCTTAEQIESELKLLQHELVNTTDTWAKLAEEIAKTRISQAKILAAKMETLLKQLNMQAKIELGFTLDKNEIAMDAGGCLEFLIATKPNQPLKPVAKVVSGGEAARLALVMQELLSEQGLTYLMDEVDVGVSGAVASSIGSLLQRISHDNQVFCITHTPQVAALAKQHISMSSAKRLLSHSERVEEIAAMLCHEGITEAAKQQAEELLS